jgi:quercetin dioxygenase-like cupin family protein
MRRTWQYAIAAGILALSGLAALAVAQDRATVVPGMKVLLDHECVRVQYHDVPVGETIPMHSHPNYVVYTLEPFRARIRLSDGTERISERKAGEAYWNEPITHSVENLGTTPVHNLIVVLKSGASCH